MTKFILHGGESGIPCESNDNYYKEIINSVVGPMKVLLVYFAVEKNRWVGLVQWHNDKFTEQANGKKIEFKVATDNTEEFSRQLRWCDVVYIRGGSTPMLQSQFEKVPNFKELIKDKVVAGSSAGALVFAKYWYDQDYDKVFDGLDVLSVKMITHYLSTGEYAATSGKDKLEKLKAHKEDLPIYAIPETEFVIVNK